VKVWNLTDVPTPALEEQRLVNISIVAAGTVLAPGGDVDVPASAAHQLKVELSSFLNLGALHIGALPKAYVAAKAATKKVVKVEPVKAQVIQPELESVPEPVIEPAPETEQVTRTDTDDRPKKKNKNKWGG
jgi:hypothetical protein